jgi:hypothetical protein
MLIDKLYVDNRQKIKIEDYIWQKMKNNIQINGCFDIISNWFRDKKYFLL